MLLAVADEALPDLSCRLALNGLEESVMLITAESIWHLGKDKAFIPAELCFISKALIGSGPIINIPKGTTRTSNRSVLNNQDFC